MLNIITHYFFEAEPSELSFSTYAWLFIGYLLPIIIVVLLSLSIN